MAKAKNMTSKQVGLKYGFRSGLEERLSKELIQYDVRFTFEERKLPFIQPEKKRTYLPDFFIYSDDGNLRFIIETKGIFTSADRFKHIWVREQYPELEFRFIFSNSRQKLSKGAKSTYGDWCTKKGFKYSDKTIPESWVNEVKK